jgi:hypothetical protein
MKNRVVLFVSIVALLILTAWQVGACQNVVENPTATQTITQPSGTSFTVQGVGSLIWPNNFRIANEGIMVFRDLSQSNAWFTAFSNDGNSTGRIQFFGGFTNSGVLVPNAPATGSVGTSANPWHDMTANNITANIINKGAGSFKIDHPLDPLNKYLQHSFVESPDMKNVYDGIAVLDKRGEAWISLPVWFQALNSDFRYQLTSVGSPGPNLFVAEEISANKFKIAGGKPGAKVSWQVTGIRQDAFAKANRIQVEEEKPRDLRGKYMHPEVFEHQPTEAAVPASRSAASESTGAVAKE